MYIYIEREADIDGIGIPYRLFPIGYSLLAFPYWHCYILVIFSVYFLWILAVLVGSLMAAGW